MLCWDRWACLFIFRRKKYVEKKRGKTFEAFISSQNNWICVDKGKKWKKLLPELAAKCLLFIIYFAPKLLTPPPLRINHIQLFHFPILLIEKFSTALQKEEKLIFKYRFEVCSSRSFAIFMQTWTLSTQNNWNERGQKCFQY